MRRYACLKDLKSANGVFLAFLRGFNQMTQAQLSTPLLHFIVFLLKVLERDAAPLFHMLKQKYQVSLSRDASFQSYLDKIGQVYFGIKPPAGMLENLLAFMPRAQ